jgi:tetratricopeptide (TPR) repeat protein
MTSRHATRGWSARLVQLAATVLFLSGAVACAAARPPARRPARGEAAAPFLKYARDARTAIRLSNRGVWLLEKGRPNEALLLFRMALAIDQDILPRDHPDSAIRLNNIGVALQSLGETGQALAYYRWALAIDEHTFGETHPDVALRLHNIGSALAAQGDTQQALTYLRRASVVRRALVAQDHPAAPGDRDGVHFKTALPAPATEETGLLQRAGTQAPGPRR